MRRVVVAVLLLASSAAAQDFIRYYPPAGAAGLSSSGTAITSTLPVLLPDGSAAAPSLAFSGQVQNGFYRPGASQLGFAIGGNERLYISNSTVMFSTALNVGWGNILTGAPDAFLSRQAAAVVQMGADAATATAQTFKAPDSTGATVAGASLTIRAGDGTSGIAQGGQLILGGGLNSSTGEPGAVAFEDRGTKPTCAVGIRGSVWYDAGGAGVADTFEVCAKQAAGDSYAWRALATIP